MIFIYFTEYILVLHSRGFNRAVIRVLFFQKEVLIEGPLQVLSASGVLDLSLPFPR